MISIGHDLDSGEIVIRNTGNDTVLRLSPDPEDFAMFAEMVVDELNDLDGETDYVLQEFVPAGEDG